MSEWISVNDRLPEDARNVIATDGTIVAEMFCIKERKAWFWRDSLVYKTITHWMPLPPPPEATK